MGWWELGGVESCEDGVGVRGERLQLCRDDECESVDELSMRV